MASSQNPGELLVQGADEPVVVRWAAWVRSHRRATAGLLALAAAGAALAAVWYVRSAPRLPVLLAASRLPSSETDVLAGTWSSGPDGRPIGPPQVTMTARLSFADLPAAGVQVVGMSGPGLRASTSSVQNVPPAQNQVSLQLKATVDCGVVPLPVPSGAYRLRLRVTEGSRATEGSLPAGALGHDWGSAVDQACGSWLARRDLAVTAVTGAADPLLPRVNLTLAITNRGSSSATLVDQDGSRSPILVSRTPAGPLRLPPGSTTQVRVVVDLRRCDAVPTVSPDVPLDTSALWLAATMGTVAQPDPAQAWFEGLGPTGVLFAQPSGTTLVGLLREACGGVTNPVVLIAQGGVQVDGATRTLTVQLLVDLPPGKVRDLRLVSAHADASDPAAFVPLWTTTPLLRPDRSGQVAVTLAYRVPAGGCSPQTGAWMPGFTAIAHVPGPAGVRTLRYSLGVYPWQDPLAINAILRLCAR